jgi:ABC-type dipeptide/oligopeptide/nickel transport system permease component
MPPAREQWLAGYLGGITDEIAMRLIDSLMALPPLVLALTITAVLGPSLVNAMLAIAIVALPGIARLVRGQVLSLRHDDYVLAARSVGVRPFPYIRSARAKGLSETQVMTHHAFKNAMLPVVTILGVQLATMFSGAVVTETIFAIPGIGRLLVDAILGRDYPVVQAVALFLTLMVVMANLLVDILYGLLDPRIRRA